MASSGGTSSGSSLLQNSGSEGDLQNLMDQRKRKRMISNRESARRSRMRKQKHLDDLTAQVTQLRMENQQIMTSVKVTTQHYLNIEAQNSVLRAQMSELSHRLESLNEIITFLNTTSNGGVGGGEDHHHHHHNHHNHNHHHDSSFSAFSNDTSFMSPMNMMYLNQPIMASADMFDQY